AALRAPLACSAASTRDAGRERPARDRENTRRAWVREREASGRLARHAACFSARRAALRLGATWVQMTWGRQGPPEFRTKRAPTWLCPRPGWLAGVRPPGASGPFRTRPRRAGAGGRFLHGRRRSAWNHRGRGRLRERCARADREGFGRSCSAYLQEVP